MAPPVVRQLVSMTPLQARSNSSAATPAFSQIPPVCMATPKFDPNNICAATPGLRVARQGEAVMSVNGSPIAL